jgi:hypothetical protein
MIEFTLKAVVPGGAERQLSHDYWSMPQALEQVSFLLYYPSESTSIVDFTRDVLVIEDVQPPVFRLNEQAPPQDVLCFVYRFERSPYEGGMAEFPRFLTLTSGFLNRELEIVSAELRASTLRIVKGL